MENLSAENRKVAILPGDQEQGAIDPVEAVRIKAVQQIGWSKTLQVCSGVGCALHGEELNGTFDLYCEKLKAAGLKLAPFESVDWNPPKQPVVTGPLASGPSIVRNEQ